MLSGHIQLLAMTFGLWLLHLLTKILFAPFRLFVTCCLLRRLSSIEHFKSFASHFCTNISQLYYGELQEQYSKPGCPCAR